MPTLKVLNIICQAGLGADCVSGGEIQAAIKAGFPASKIVYAGVGKSDWEINLGSGEGHLLLQCREHSGAWKSSTSLLRNRIR